MKSNSEELFQRSLKVTPGGVHSPVRAFKSVESTPIFFKQAQGAFLTSVEGKEYVDFCQSFGPLILGHRDPDVSRIVKETADMAWSFGTCEPYSLELAEWITNKIKWVEKVRFVCSGTEAVMTALRIARAATNRSKILKFEGCYHGHFDSLLVKAGSGLAGDSASDSAGVTNVSDTLTIPLDDEEKLENVFKTHGDQIAAVIIEPLPANYGLLVQRKEFIQKLEKLTRSHGALLIFDEVISGFRVALGGMAEILKIEPDLVTYGKVIGGGFPVGAYGGKAKLLDLIAPQGPVYQAGTLSANPFGMRAGLATLMKMENENIIPTLQKKTESFSKSINELFEKYSHDLQISSFASLFWIHSRTNKPVRSIDQIPKDHKKKFNQFFHNVLVQGIYLAPSAYEVGFMSWAHSDEVLYRTLEKIETALRGGGR